MPPAAESSFKMPKQSTASCAVCVYLFVILSLYEVSIRAAEPRAEEATAAAIVASLSASLSSLRPLGKRRRGSE